MGPDPPPQRALIAGLVLAAGGSTRLGRPKQLLRWPPTGESLLRRAVRVACAVCPRVIVVLGADAASCREELRDLDALAIVNDDWSSGMASSLRMGIEVAAASPATAVITMLCDQPRVGEAELRALAEAHRTRGAPIVAASVDGRLGVPALFARACFDELRAVRGDEGARAILRGAGARVLGLSMPAAAMDIDTEDDYRALSRESVASQ